MERGFRTRTFVILLALVTFLASACTAEKPALRAAPQLDLIERPDGWEIPALKSAGSWYLWSPDNRWLAFQTASGLWALSADGVTRHLLQPGDGTRQLAGWWDGSLVFVDYGTGVGSGGPPTVQLARPGEGARVVAQLDGLRESASPLSLVTALTGPNLGIWESGGRSLHVDLRTGTVRDMGGEPALPPSASFLPSPSGRYALFKDASRWDRLRLYDLQEGGEVRSREVYPYLPVWAPLEDRWAAVAGPAAADGAGPTASRTDSTAGGAFGVAIDIGDPSLHVTHLVPPVPLKLRDGPWWSGDGRELAVMAEVRPPSDGRYRDAVNEVWVVTIASNTWRRLTEIQFLHVQGWHPDGRSLVVWEIRSSAGSWKAGRMDLADGTVQWLPGNAPKRQDPTRIDPELWVVGTPNGPKGPTAYLEQPAAPPLPLAAAQAPVKDDLQFRPPYVSWLEYRDAASLPGLVVLRRPESSERSVLH